MRAGWVGSEHEARYFGSAQVRLGFAIPAALKVPVAAKPRTGRVGIEGCRDLIPGDEPVFGHAYGIVGVADALELADSDEPVENSAGVAFYHGIGDAVSREARLNVVEVIPWSGSDGGLGRPPHKRPITNKSLHRTTLGQPF